MSKTVIAVCAACLVAVYVMGLRMDIAKKQARQAQAEAAQAAVVINKERRDAEALSIKVTTYENAIHAIHQENDALRSSDAAGSTVVRVSAKCPDMPQAASAATPDHESSPELDEVARQAFFDLRRDAQLITQQLLACQDYARVCSKSD